MSGDRITLEVKERGADQLGTRNVKRLRRQGLIPGVLYGKVNKAFVVGERELRSALTGPSGLHGIVDVVIEGQKAPHHAVLKDYQQHPIRGTITHIDFHEVRLDQPIQASVAVQLVGEAPGSKVGGVVQQVSRDLTVEALPAAIPEHVEVDLSGLELGELLRLSDVPAIEGVTFLDDPDTVLANCTAPRGLAEDEDAEEAEGEGEGEEGEGEEGGLLRRPPMTQPPGTSLPPTGNGRSVVGVSRPRRLTFSSSGSATRGASTSATGTTSAPWSSTSSHGVTTGRSKGSFAAGWRRSGSPRARVALLAPETYMNESGQSVQPAVRFFKVPADALLVVHDEVDLDYGRLQARLGGGLAGHNGLRSIASQLGTQEFLRLRVGVGRPGRDDPRDVADYVLSPFAPEDDVEGLVGRAADAVESLVADGLDETQRRFNS